MVRVKVRVRHRVHVQCLADVVGLDEIFAQNFALQFYSICCKQHSYILCSWLNNLILVRCPTLFFFFFPYPTIWAWVGQDPWLGLVLVLGDGMGHPSSVQKPRWSAEFKVEG